MLHDEDRYVRRGVAIALGQIGDARGVDPLIASLRDPDPSVRMSAAEALGKIGDARAVPALKRVAQMDHGVTATGFRVSDAALTALKWIRM